MGADFPPPFRWDISKREQLGQMVEGVPAPDYLGFAADLRKCCARILAFAGDADLFFVGRSPESLFDYLSGLLLETPWLDRLYLLHFSMRYTDSARILQGNPKAFAGLRSYLRQLGLAPEQLPQRTRPVAFVDLVAEGQTLGNLIGLLHQWGREVNVAWDLAKM